MTPTKRDIVEVKALRDHLRAEQHRRLRRRELLEQALVRPLPAGGVGIHADDGHARPHPRHGVERAAQLVFHPLRSRAELLQIRARALRAHRRRCLPVTAMVARQEVASLMVGERRVAVRALRHEAAFAAQQKLRETALIEQEHRFAPLRKLLLQGPRKGGGEHGARTLGELARHIHHADGRHRTAVGALGQADLRPTRMLRAPVERLNRGRGAAEHHRGAAATGHPARDLARMVARCAVLLIAALVLLVDDVEPHVDERGEKRAARAHHHAGRAAANEVPLVVAFTRQTCANA